MSFAVLRDLHAILADALDDMQRVYDPDRYSPLGPSSLQGEEKPYLSPISTSSSNTPLDFPSLDTPYDPADPSEQLTTHPTVVVAINRIIAAAGQMAAIVQTPFLTLCDASMGYHLPSCLRLLEASHTIEILREAGPQGLHVDAISEQNGVESVKLAHVLRLLATHHIIRECAPNVFAINRISSTLDSGKSAAQLRQYESDGRPEMKYPDTNGIAAFVGLCTDELMKSAAYMTDAYLQSRGRSIRTPFEHAFNTNVGYFEWLEGQGAQEKPVPKGGRQRSRDEHNVEKGRGAVGRAAQGKTANKSDSEKTVADGNPNRFRLERFGKAMSGSVSWEVPSAVLKGFDWKSLPRGSVIVDVGGGIGSTTMLLANAFSRAVSGGDEEGLDLGLEFVVQDRQVVVEMGKKAWGAKRPELLDSGTVKFQVHDFFNPQPIKNAAVFFLRVVLHDWQDSSARMILLKLREAATEHTKLVLADFVLPLACADDVGPRTTSDGDADVLDGVEDAETKLAAAPLLPNLGKASANAYWMDLTMQATFNAQERTLREMVALALSAGWKVIKMTRAVGSLFGHIVAVPVPIPIQKPANGSAFLDVPNSANSVVAGQGREAQELELVERVHSRSGTPTFGSRSATPTFGSTINLPSAQQKMDISGGVARSRSRGKPNGLTTRRGSSKPSMMVTIPANKNKSSPLAIQSPPTSPSQRQSPPTLMRSRMSQAHPLRSQSQRRASPQQTPLTPISPRHAPLKTSGRRPSHSNSIPPSPSALRENPALSRRASRSSRVQPSSASQNSLPLSPTSPIYSKPTPVGRRLSYAQASQAPLGKANHAGGVLKFECHDNEGQEMCSPVPGAGNGGSLLAAAAKIESGIPPSPPSP